MCTASPDDLAQLFPDITAALDLWVMLLVGSCGSGVLCSSRTFACLASPQRPAEFNENDASDRIWLLFNAEFDPLLRNNMDNNINLNSFL